jgi:hypothetical protein
LIKGIVREGRKGRKEKHEEETFLERRATLAILKKSFALFAFFAFFASFADKKAVSSQISAH